MGVLGQVDAPQGLHEGPDDRPEQSVREQELGRRPLDRDREAPREPQADKHRAVPPQQRGQQQGREREE